MSGRTPGGGLRAAMGADAVLIAMIEKTILQRDARASRVCVTVTI